MIRRTVPATTEQDPTVGSDTGQSATGPSCAAIELSGVRRRFGPVVAVDDVSWTVPRGQIMALLGPNGAGKSTLTEIVLGLQVPDAGTVSVLGHSPRAAVGRGLTGAMLQNGALLENVTAGRLLRLMYGLAAHPLPLDEVIARADIGDFLRTRTERLSGGQAQRLRFALAILGDPQLLILDEPTVAMDVETRHRFWDSMRDLVADGRTVVFATHYLEEADAVADRVVLLAEGQVVADGTGADVKASVGGRQVSFTTTAGVTDAELLGLPGVVDLERSGARIRLRSTDSDRLLRQLCGDRWSVSEIEVVAPRLEDAFLRLTTRTDSRPAHHQEAA